MERKEEILKRYSKKEDKILISNLLGKLENTRNRDMTNCTSFLDMYEQKICIGELNRCKAKYIAFGGYDAAEKKCIYLLPEHIDCVGEYENISAIKIINKGYKTLGHRDYLGSLFALGIKGDKLGDVLIYEKYAIVFVIDTIREYILLNMLSVGSNRVLLEEINLDKIEVPKIETKEIIGSIPSLRLDNVLCLGFKLTRSDTSVLIDKEKSFVNGESITNRTKEVQKGDIITLRGYGKIVLKDIIGKSKKDKIIVLIEKY